MTSSKRRALVVLPIWLLCLGWMWSWWLNPGRINFMPLFVPLTLALLYEFALLPTIFIYFVLRAKRPPRTIAPKGKKVAVITLCVPSQESIDIVERQLKSMVEITYPHDSWILDEGNSPQIKRLARSYGVNYFTRKGIRKYNQKTPPFKAKTKAGNVNAWLEHVKRRKYDFFVQFDIDHNAKPNYLNKTLGYFRDPEVAWVQAPSVYKNRDSWVARGSSEQELALQGPLQMGFYGHSDTPFIIGSHTTYRMSAIREIGGYQPTRAEDHLDTVVLSARGYRGIFLPEIIAEGDGPETLNTYLAQQFAWAYSMFQVLVSHMPKQIRSMSWRQRLQFLFAQTWYPLWSISYLIMFLSPIASLLLNRDIAVLKPWAFATHFLPVFAMSFVVWWAARPLMNPPEVHLSWRGMLLHVVRWPVVLIAVINALFKIKRPYMITPKGKFSQAVPALKTYRPFLLFSFLSVSSVYYGLHFGRQTLLAGQVLFALINATFMFSICFIDLNLRLRQMAAPLFKIPTGWFKPIAVTAMLGVMISGAIIAAVPAFSGPVSAAPTLARSVPETPVSLMTTDELKSKLNLLSNNAHVPIPALGIYSQQPLPSSNTPYIEHIFIGWKDDNYLAKELLLSLRKRNTPLITIEPRGDPNGAELLKNITAGVYDDKLNEMSSILGATKRPIYVRFAHEMDLYNLYPWGGQNPAQYVAAYRHAITYMRSHGATNVKWVWSPAGNQNASAYYPGDDVVDVIGTTVLHDKFWYGSEKTPFTKLAEKRVWMKKFGKPLWVTEFGAGAADPNFQQTLIDDGLKNYKSMGFDSLVYLSMVDANVVGPDYHLQSPSEFSNLFTPRAPAPESASVASKQLQPNRGPFDTEKVYLSAAPNPLKLAGPKAKQEVAKKTILKAPVEKPRQVNPNRQPFDISELYLPATGNLTKLSQPLPKPQKKVLIKRVRVRKARPASQNRQPFDLKSIFLPIKFKPWDVH